MNPTKMAEPWKSDEPSQLFSCLFITRLSRQDTFPEVLKIARVLLILKQSKFKMKKDSYRPISNLHSAEKVFEEHLKLEQYLAKNHIRNEHYHGSRLHRSALTVKSAAENHVVKGYEN